APLGDDVGGRHDDRRQQDPHRLRRRRTMRFPAATKAGGTALATPDTCNLPTPGPPGGAPTPYPNTGTLDSADKCTEKVVIMNKGACVEDSEIGSTHGDEPGCSSLPTPKGLVSQSNLSKVVFK